jgi:hypothetical protein
MEAISLDVPSSLSDDLYQELRLTLRGDAYRRGDPRHVVVFPDYFLILMTVVAVFWIILECLMVTLRFPLWLSHAPSMQRTLASKFLTLTLARYPIIFVESSCSAENIHFLLLSRPGAMAPLVGQSEATLSSTSARSPTLTSNLPLPMAPLLAFETCLCLAAKGSSKLARRF